MKNKGNNSENGNGQTTGSRFSDIDFSASESIVADVTCIATIMRL